MAQTNNISETDISVVIDEQDGTSSAKSEPLLGTTTMTYSNTISTQ